MIPQGRGGADDGFTLLELVFALVLLSVGIAALIGVLATSFRSTAVDIHRSDAISIAAQGLTELKGAPATGPLPSVTRNGQTFNVSGTVSSAPASDGKGTYPQLAVTVAWTDAAGTHSLSQSTALFTSPPTTSAASSCSTLGAVDLDVNSPSGDPSLDLSWQEPTGGPVSRWQVQISPDGTTWTTAIADEKPLPAGATHQLEIGALAPGATYQVHLVATTACGATQVYSKSGGPTPAVSAPCEPGSMTLGPAIGQRVTTGAAAGTLTSDITVVVTTPHTCSSLFVFANTGHGVVSSSMSPTGTYTYSGTLQGVGQIWDLGVHRVAAYAGFRLAGTGLLCVEEQGAGTC